MSDSTRIETGFAEVNGTRLYYEVAGTGHPLVLSHGFLTDKSSWDDQFQILAQHFKVIRYDLRGFGASGLIEGPYSQRDDLYALLKSLGVEKTYLLGLSGSGSLVIDFTLEHPEMVASLIPVSSGVSGLQLEEETDGEWPAEWLAFADAKKRNDVPGMAEAMLRFWIDGSKRPADQVDPDVRQRVQRTLEHNYALPNDPGGWNLPIALDPPAANRLSEVTIPTLIIIGDKDEDETLTTADYLATHIKGARKIVITNTTHHPNMEKPEEFNRAILDFLTPLSA